MVLSPTYTRGERGGDALFITTPRGRNHASSFYDMARKVDDWYCEKQTVNDTDVFTKEQLNRILQELIALYGQQEGQARYEQEYLCSFDAALPGSYWGAEMNQLEEDGRWSGVPHTRGQEVYACWDFGKGQTNATAIVFIQIIGREPRIIDYFESSTDDIESHGLELVKGKREEYMYGKLILPHDAGWDRLATGMSYQAQLEDMGFNTEVLIQTPDKNADIRAGRNLIKQMWIDNRSCDRLVDCLRSYHREWDPKLKRYATTPKHDWASHGADAFQQAAVAYRQGLLIPDIYDYDEEEDYTDDSRNTTTGY